MPEKIKTGQKIAAEPAPNPEIGIDVDDSAINNIVAEALNGTLNISALEGFQNVSQTREQLYKLLDSMSYDSTLSAVLETYAEDICEPNERGEIVWCESENANVLKYVTFLLNSINVDKQIYSWAYSLVKYGDVYLRLYRESEQDDGDLFDDDDKTKKQRKLTETLDSLNSNPIAVLESQDREEVERINSNEDNKLREDVNINVYSQNDRYVHYVEMVSNPGEMFELTRFGKTAAYVQAPVSVQQTYTTLQTSQPFVNYAFRKNDVDIYAPGSFVHAALEDNSSRIPEEVSISVPGENGGNEKKLTYKVKRGQSILYNAAKNWRELTLLENSVLLNRVTKSSIVRLIGVEVGDMPKEQIGVHLRSIKALIEQKSSLKDSDNMSDYTNPGPIENNVYVPTHNGVGAISTQQIGGDVDVKSLIDLDHFNNKLFGSLRVPKQFFGWTDGSTGFNGGTSLTIISSRYGKAIKRFQNVLCQMITDIINLYLLDRGLLSYVNEFTIRMNAPTTQEEIDKRESMTNRIRYITDVMNTLNDIDDKSIKLSILKSLLTPIVDPEIILLIQQQIDALEKEEESEPEEVEETTLSREETIEEPSETVATEDEIEETEESSIETPEETPEESEEQLGYLPSPDELNIDMTRND